MLKNLLIPTITVALVVIFSVALSNIDSDRSSLTLSQTEEAVRRSCISCYSAEGVYPPSLDYLKEKYGLQIDEENYAVFYTAVGGNLMPDITVLEKNSK